MESNHIIIILIVIILMILSAMAGMFANNHMADKETPVNNTTKDNSSVAMTNGTDEEQPVYTETHTETSNAKQNNNNQNNNPNNNNPHEDAEVITTYPDEEESDSEDTSGHASEIYVDDRGRVSVGYWDDEGYWNAEYVV